ncbi:uncharacterized protein LAESUDRAFT_670928 [Laetiporus sulphureus 93-53]|uniref:Uncharacterized protein n=1 Tax=Laetiporus sulphureus 93-53 TaxID=1314785 RepID=A0A165H3S6_9APHY|nr:uncharacterized protein LAESUDRAFT_670928 [Laetiporus sulphureus 93-53]KZT11203.1 hypothetical protein LAESUDRAFT_670928 [Laetiporus sulphureus 93-53]
MMEIDMSVSAGALRASRSMGAASAALVTSTSTKRARSPVSPSAYDRPAKRPLVGDDVSIAIPIARYPHVSEDWVAQTRGLRIASPMLPPGHGPLRSSVEEDSRTVARVDGGGLQDFPLADEDVAMACSPPRLRHGIDALSEPPRPTSVSSCQPELPPHSITPTPVIAPSFHPHASSISAALAAPSHLAPSHHCQDPREAAHMARKQKFTMGPRADCEKCRLGVKGHWMHFD